MARDVDGAGSEGPGADRIVARGRVVKAGRSLTVAQSEVFGESGGEEKLIGLLTATLGR